MHRSGLVFRSLRLFPSFIVFGFPMSVVMVRQPREVLIDIGDLSKQILHRSVVTIQKYEFPRQPSPSPPASSSGPCSAWPSALAGGDDGNAEAPEPAGCELSKTSLSRPRRMPRAKRSGAGFFCFCCTAVFVRYNQARRPFLCIGGLAL